MDGESSRNRAPNWSYTEMRVLLEGIYAERDVIQKKCTMEITNRKKREAWANIQTRVNACGVGHRTITNIKDKWGQMRAPVLKKDKYGGGTGGDKEHKPVPFEEIITKIVSDNTVLKEGIQGIGTDSFAASQQNTVPERNIANILQRDPVTTTTSSGDTAVLPGILGEGDLSVQISSTETLKVPPSVSTPPRPVRIQTAGDTTVATCSVTAGDMSGMSPIASPVVTDIRLSDDVNPPAPARHQQTSSTALQLEEQQQQQPTKTWRTLQLKRKRDQRKRLSFCDEDALFKDYLRSEIEKNRSEIEKNKQKAELIASQIAKNKAETDLAKLKVAKLQKEVDAGAILIP